jgi:SAM-dependent methyltransferase
MPSNAIRDSLRSLLKQSRLLQPAKAALSFVLGNSRLRRLATSNFSSGKIAIGERNVYTFPTFPLDWTRIDIEGSDFNLDLTRDARLPFPDSSQRIVYAAHVVEHLGPEPVAHLLRECHRILRPGGAIRIEAPDAEFLISAYRQRNERVLGYFRMLRRRRLVEALGLPTKYLEDHLTVLGELSNYIDRTCGSGHIPVYAPVEIFDEKLASLDRDSFVRWCVSLQTPEQRGSGGHQNWMSAAKLQADLEVAGFQRVLTARFGETRIPGLSLNAGAGSIREKRHRAFYSVYIEAFK